MRPAPTVFSFMGVSEQKIAFAPASSTAQLRLKGRMWGHFNHRVAGPLATIEILLPDTTE